MFEIDVDATKVIIAIFFILIPFVVLIFCYKRLKKIRQVEKKCTCCVNGVIYHVEKTVSTSNDVDESTSTVTIYRPSVSYVVNGKTYTGQSLRANSKLIEEGTEVIIHYDPSDPESFYIDGYKQGDIAFILVPLLLIVFGIVMFILYSF